MEPWLSWGIAILVGGLAFAYYNSQKKPQATRLRTASTSEISQPAPKPARKREEARSKPKTQPATSSGAAVPRVTVESGNVGADANKKRKVAKKQQIPAAAAQPPQTRSSQHDDDDEAEGDDTKAWAQGLSALKKGTNLAPPSRTDSRGRTVKQSAANFSSTSLSNAADGDDDLTPALSPSLAAGDVSDMLEPTSSGPSVLRLTESSKPAKAKQQRQKTPAQAAETKKQRQNKQKVEERRIAREQEEKERMVLLENQRRTARESRGEPAKNGIVSSKPPAASEWAVRAANRAIQQPVESTSTSKSDNGGLLDTFNEDDQVSKAKKLSEDESGWNTVPKGKKQKKRTTEGIDSTGDESAPSAFIEQPSAPTAAPAVSKPTPVSKSADAHTNGYQSLYNAGYETGSHPENSQWSA